DIRMASSVMDYIFRRLALDYLPYEERAALGIFSASERAAQQRGEDPAALHSEEGLDAEALAQSAPIEVGSGRSASSAGTAAPQREQTATRALESHQGRTADAPLCMTCGTKMRPAGTCYVCEGCGSTSGCS